MKPTYPTFCPLQQAINELKLSKAQDEEAEQILEQLSPLNRRRALAAATFLYYRQQGLARPSTWLEMLERQRVLYFLWGCFERLDFATTKGRW